MSTNVNVQKGITIAKARCTDTDVVDVIAKGIVNSIKATSKKYDKIVFFNIGTDRVTGDSFGPMFGSMMERQGGLHDKIVIHGTLENPNHAKNIQDNAKYIDFENNFVIGVDASLGVTSEIGTLIVKNKGIKAGAGLGKNLGEYGDICVQGVTSLDAESSELSFSLLHKARLSLVYNMVTVMEKVVVKVSDYLATQDVKDTYEQPQQLGKVISLFA